MLLPSTIQHYALPTANVVLVLIEKEDSLPTPLRPSLLHSKLVNHTLVYSDEHIVVISDNDDGKREEAVEGDREGEVTVQVPYDVIVTKNCKPVPVILQFRVHRHHTLPLSLSSSSSSGKQQYGVKITHSTGIFPVSLPVSFPISPSLSPSKAMVTQRCFDLFQQSHSFSLSPRQSHSDFDRVLIASQSTSSLAMIQGLLAETLQSYSLSQETVPSSSSSSSLSPTQEGHSLLLCGPRGSGPCSLVTACCTSLSPLTCLVLSAERAFARGRRRAHEVLFEVFSLALAMRPCVLVLDDLQILTPRHRAKAAEKAGEREKEGERGKDGEREKGREREREVFLDGERDEDVLENVCCILGMLLSRLHSPSPSLSRGLCVIGVCDELTDVDAGIVAQFSHSLSLGKMSEREREAMCLAITQHTASLSPSLSPSFSLSTEELLSLSLSLSSSLSSSLASGFPFSTLRQIFDDFSLTVRPNVRAKVEKAREKQRERGREGFGLSLSLSSPTTIFQQRERERLHSLGCEVLMERERELFGRMLHWPRLYKPLYAQLGLTHQSTNILLYGPSGSGKTLLPSLWAAEYSLSLLSPRVWDLVHGAIGESERAIKRTFSAAKLQSPALLFFDEFDAIFGSSSSNSTQDSDAQGTDATSLSAALIAALDDLHDWNACTDSKVYVIAATRSPSLVDARFLQFNRFGSSLKLDLLGQETKVKWWERVREREKWDEAFSTEDVAWLCEQALSPSVSLPCDAIHFLKEVRYFRASMSPGESVRESKRFNGPTPSTEEEREAMMAPYNEWQSRNKSSALFE